MTTNEKEIQGDDSTAGDRTLLILCNNKEMGYHSYTLTDPKFESVSKAMKTQESVWVFFYFGYNPKTRSAYAYNLLPQQENSQLIGGV